MYIRMCTNELRKAKKVECPPGVNLTPHQTDIGIIP